MAGWLRYPAPISGCDWSILNLNSVVISASFSSPIRSDSTWLPWPSPDAFAAASLINNFTCHITFIFLGFYFFPFCKPLSWVTSTMDFSHQITRYTIPSPTTKLSIKSGCHWALVWPSSPCFIPNSSGEPESGWYHSVRITSQDFVGFHSLQDLI